MIMNNISYIERRCEYYINKMDKLLELYKVGDDWIDLPDLPLQQYKQFSNILAELQLVLKHLTNLP